MNIFRVSEIIDLGIEKEKKRRDFYKKVSETFNNKEMKDLFTKLKNWEEGHISKFTEIRKKSSDYETTESYPGELGEYMRTLIEDKLDVEVISTIFSKNVKTPLDAINYGIIFEKDAILFFNELLPFMTSGDKDPVQQIINEEKQHLIYLDKLKQAIG